MRKKDDGRWIVDGFYLMTLLGVAHISLMMGLFSLMIILIFRTKVPQKLLMKYYLWRAECAYKMFFDCQCETSNPIDNICDEYRKEAYKYDTLYWEVRADNNI